MNKKKRYTSIPFEVIRIAELKDPARAAMEIEYAFKCYEEEQDLVYLLDFLGLVAKAQGGFANLAKNIKISRQAINTALSEEGNPRIKTFQDIIRELGFKMVFVPIEKKTN